MTKEEAAGELTELFPEKTTALAQHYADYNNQLLGHLFFADEINLPLIDLLRSNTDKPTIQKYCSFIEHMYATGDEDVKNVVDVTIVEQLSDEELIWFRFGTYLSNDFIREINTVILPQNSMISSVPHLPYRRRRAKP